MSNNTSRGARGRKGGLSRAAGAMTLAAVVALTGCSSFRDGQTVDVFEASLSGAQEVPAVASTGTGQAELRLNEARSVIRWTIRYDGLSGPVTAAHLHGPATPAQNAPATVPFAGALQAPLTGEVQITREQAGQLMSGQWYVNLHTERHPQGEIRGQLRPRP